MVEVTKPKKNKYGFFVERKDGETTESMVSRCYEGIRDLIASVDPDQSDKTHTITLTCGSNEMFASMKVNLTLGETK